MHRPSNFRDALLLFWWKNSCFIEEARILSFLEGKEKFENNTFQNGWYFSAFMVFVDSEANIEVNDFLIELSCASEKILVETLMKNVRPEFTEEHEFVYQVNKISRFCLQYPDYQETDAIKKRTFFKRKTCHKYKVFDRYSLERNRANCNEETNNRISTVFRTNNIVSHYRFARTVNHLKLKIFPRKCFCTSRRLSIDISRKKLNLVYLEKMSCDSW